MFTDVKFIARDTGELEMCFHGLLQQSTVYDFRRAARDSGVLETLRRLNVIKK